jgi:putative Ca2+/H+ antiporter (TMEM165/GDT1 family)
MGLWILIPDKDDGTAARYAYGAFVTTLISFFLVEIGDKTQVATAALAARFHEIAYVTVGTTLGMLLANVPAVYLGEAATRVVPLKWVRIGAATIFVALGLWALADATGLW